MWVALKIMTVYDLFYYETQWKSLFAKDTKRYLFLGALIQNGVLNLPSLLLHMKYINMKKK